MKKTNVQIYVDVAHIMMTRNSPLCLVKNSNTLKNIEK